MKLACYSIIILLVLTSCSIPNSYVNKKDQTRPPFHHWFAPAPSVDTLCWSSSFERGPESSEQLERGLSLQIEQLDSLWLYVKSESELLKTLQNYNWKNAQKEEAVYAGYWLQLFKATTAYLLYVRSESLHDPVYALVYNHQQGVIDAGYRLADYNHPSESGTYDCYSCWTGVQHPPINWLTSYKQSYSQHQTLQFPAVAAYRSFVYVDSVAVGWYQYQQRSFQSLVVYEQHLLSRDEPTTDGRDTLVDYNRTHFYYNSHVFRDSTQAYQRLRDAFGGWRQWAFN